MKICLNRYFFEVQPESIVNSKSIEHFENQKEKINLAAVKRDGFAIQYIENPSYEIQLAAIENNYASITVIEDPSEFIQIAAIKKNYVSILGIKKPTESALMVTIEECDNIIFLEKMTKMFCDLPQIIKLLKNKILVLSVLGS